MLKKTTEIPLAESSGKRLISGVSRRKFINYAGLSAGAMLVASSCSKELRKNPQGDTHLNSEGGGKDGGKRNVNLGEGDIGILNYAYALEQLEAAFYIQAVATPYSGMSSDERIFLTDIRDHEIAHREFFKAVLGDDRIGGLILDFSTINFGSRASVLGTARAFEDLGVSAYNGAGYLLKNADYLLYAGKIVSVEARHAALIRELLVTNSFLGDQVDENSVNISRTPQEVLAIADKYILTNINSKNLPTG